MPEDKYRATLEGIDLEIQDISDSFKKSIVKHEIPYTDGPILEDMGQTARTLRFRCFFFDNTYDTHEELIQLLEIQELLELHHPKYGIVEGSIESLDIHHDSESLRSAKIDVNFVENLRGEQTLTEDLTDIGSVVELSFLDAITEQIKEIAVDIQRILGADAIDILGETLDIDLDFIDQFTDVVGKPRQFLTQINDMIGTAKSALNTITNPARSLLTTYDFLYNTGSHMIFNAAGYISNIISNTVERYSLNHNSRKIAPTRFTESFIADVKTLKDITLPQSNNNEIKQAAIDVFKKHVQISMAQQASLDLGYIYDADERVRQVQKKIEGKNGGISGTVGISGISSDSGKGKEKFFENKISSVVPAVISSASNGISSVQSVIPDVTGGVTGGVTYIKNKRSTEIESIVASGKFRKKMEGNKNFDALGKYRKPETIVPQIITGTYSTSEEFKVSSLTTIKEIERSLSNVRTEIQITVDDSRNEISLSIAPPSAISEGQESESQVVEKMKELARQLFLHVNEIKLEREKIINVQIENETPLHYICLMYGLDYNTADRIHAINDIRTPNFTKGNISIYAR